MAVPYKLSYLEIETGLSPASTFKHTGDFLANRIIKYLGTSDDILLGDGSTASLADLLTLDSLSASSPLSYNNLTGAFSIAQASASTSGYLSSTDWNTFNNKQPAGNYVTLDTAQTITGQKTFTSDILANAITLDPTPATIPTAQGSMYFDNANQTVAAVLNGVTMKIGEDLFFQIKNQSGSPIPKGTALRFDGVVGSSGRIKAVPFLANGTYPSIYFLGVAYETIPNGGDGKALYFGNVRGVNTNAYPAGTVLYASTTVAGGYQTTAPAAPNNIISVAAVVTQGVSNGQLLVRPLIGSNINNDEGVLINTPITGDLLQLQSDGLWKNKSVASLNLVPQSRTLTINGTGYDLTADRSWSVGTITSLTGEATASGSGAVSVTLDNNSVTGKLLSGVNITGGTVLSTDSILTAFGKLQNQINGLVGGSTYQGVWNANTNTPALTSSAGTNGHYYIVNVAGSTNLNGETDWKVGDWAIFSGTSWTKVDNTDAVVSVNGFTGAVSLTTSNITEGTSLYFTNARAIASTLTGYTSGAGTISASDTILSAIQKLNGNIGALSNNYVTLDTVQTITASKTFQITSGSDVPLTILKGGNGEGLIVNKSSGSGNAVTVIGDFEATVIKKTGGTANQVLRADGTVTEDLISFGEVYNKFVQNDFGNFTTGFIPKITNDGVSTYIIGNSQLQDNGTNVSVGYTTNPSLYKLDVNGTLRATGAATFSSSVTAASYFNSNDGTRNVYLNPAADFGIGANPAIQVASNHALQFATNNTIRAIITNGGNVLIGTTTDAGYKLDVNGTGRFSGILNIKPTSGYATFVTDGPSGSDWVMRVNGVDKHEIYNTATSFNIYNTTTSTVALSIANSTGAATFSGNIIISKATPLFVLNDTSGSVAQIGSFGGNLNLIDNATGTKGLVINLSTGTATFSSTVTATAFIPTSDIRLKNLIDYDYNVELIKPITYTWKDGEDKRKKIGYSAQQIKEILPEVVNSDEKGMLSVDYNQIFVAKIYMLENMIQELNEKIIQLENK